MFDRNKRYWTLILELGIKKMCFGEIWIESWTSQPFTRVSKHYRNLFISNRILSRPWGVKRMLFGDDLDRMFNVTTFHMIVRTWWNLVYCQIPCFWEKLNRKFNVTTFLLIVETLRNFVFRNRRLKQSDYALESPNNQFLR